MRRIVFLLLAATILVPMTVTASGQAEPAEGPGELVIYSSVDEANAKKVLDAFTADTGIEVAFVHLSTGPALARIEAEMNNPQADVWMGAPNENHILARDRGLTIPHSSDATMEIPEQFRDANGYWTSFYMNPMAIAVNTEALDREGIAAPTSWEDLTKPEYRGLIQMPSPQSSGTAYNVVTSLVQARGEDAAFEYMSRLNPNIQTYTSSGTAPSQAVAVGEAPIGIQFTPAFFQFADEGYPVEVIFPSEGVGYEAPAISILKGARNEASARELVDWIVSTAGQNVLTEAKTYFYPVNPNAELGAGMPSFDSLRTIPVDPTWAGENKERLVERWVEEVLPAQ
ncbi:MAG: ABC transporter substrate-binding protein [Spirochaeta sp.]|jgi:iron(III) transport system substrate-binding protein|nr:ABC transporter substrate-binding protein [Spirochaeta sp.]